MEYEIHTTKKTLRKYRAHIIIGLIALVVIGVIVGVSIHKSDPTIQEQTIDIKDYKIINTYVREGKQYYTQGLMFKGPNTLLESSGLKGESVIHYLSFPNMTVLNESALAREYFGEGCEIVDNNGTQEIYQLTWQNRKIFVWDAETLEQKRILDLPQPIREGWGIAKRNETDNNGNQVTRLYITDGSSNLYVADPLTMEVLKTIPVKRYDGLLVYKLNELEFIKGYLWANIYLSNNIAVINVDTGYVEYMIYLDGLDTLAKQKATEMKLNVRPDYVLNGIAYDSTNDRLIIAGKKWPLMWEIQIDGIN